MNWDKITDIGLGITSIILGVALIALRIKK